MSPSIFCNISSALFHSSFLLSLSQAFTSLILDLLFHANNGFLSPTIHCDTAQIHQSLMLEFMTQVSIQICLLTNSMELQITADSHPTLSMFLFYHFYYLRMMFPSMQLLQFIKYYNMCLMGSKQFNLIQLMLMKKQRRIMRHRLPNLCSPGMKFDQFNSDGPSFFNKISNTLKLLEQPIQFSKAPSRDQGFNFNQYLKNRLKRNSVSTRTNQLAQPKHKSFSLSKRQQFTNKKQIKLRYSTSQIQNKSLNSSKIKSQQIIGTGLASLPLQQILAARQQYLKVKQNMLNLDSEQDEEEFDKIMNEVEDLQPLKEDFKKWSEKIIGGQGKLYEQYEKSMLDKVKQDRRRTKKVSHQVVWK